VSRAQRHKQCGRRGSRQDGFSIVMAIFLIVVLAGLATFVVQISMTQFQSTNLEVLQARAQAAAETGIEYAAYVALNSPTANCPVSALTLSQGALNGYVFKVSCWQAPSTHAIVGGSPATAHVYPLTSIATYRTYGTSPDYVMRQLQQNVTDAKPP
jgi:MSHA biogenesis protein MshP